MDQRIIELNAQIKNELKKYNYDYIPFYLISDVNSGTYQSVTKALKHHINLMNHFKDLCGLESFKAFTNELIEINKLNYMDVDPLINIENSDKPELLTVAQLQDIINNLDDVKKILSLK